MTTSVTFNGVAYSVPAIADASWGTNVSNYLIAISTGCLQKTGGTFTLTAEVNFGATYGLKAAYLKSQTANIAAAGFLELAKTDTISWRNNANSADLALAIDSSNRLTFNGVVLETAGVGAIVNADISASAAIDFSKLAVLASGNILVGSAGGVATSVAMSGDVTIAAGGATTIGATKVTNAMLAGSIAYSKLALTGAILNADLAGSIAYSKLSLTGAILNADLAAAVSIAKGGTGQATAALAFAALSPVTTKGDLLTFDTVNNRLPVGADGLVLTASSAAATGLAWAAGASTTLAQYSTDIGNSSNTRTATNTNLLGDIKGTALSQIATMTIAAPGVVTSNSHGLSLGDKFYFTTTGALPTGVTASTTYYASAIATNTFNISTTRSNAIAGTYVTTTGSQSGTHTLVTGGLVLAKLRGTLTNDNATSGDLGEYVQSVVSTATNYPGATNAWGDATSIALTPGDWDVTFVLESRLNGASNSSEVLFGISATSGNSATGLTRGDNYFSGTQGTAPANASYSIANYRVQLAAAATYYAKLQTGYSAGNPQYLCRLSARRVR